MGLHHIYKDIKTDTANIDSENSFNVKDQIVNFGQKYPDNGLMMKDLLLMNFDSFNIDKKLNVIYYNIIEQSNNFKTLNMILYILLAVFIIKLIK